MGHLDPIVEKVRRESEDKIKFQFEQTFMFYLPRICEHCLNPSCMASCPSGAIYKREEDGIVLVDRDPAAAAGDSASPNVVTRRSTSTTRPARPRSATLCYPRLKVGLPTVCSETCVGRLRYLGLFLYDADRVTEAASTPDERDLYAGAARPDPRPPAIREVIAAARSGHPGRLDGRRTPLARLRAGEEVPGGGRLHPEYRTMPMVWYIPPLSPDRRPAARSRARRRVGRHACSGRSDALRMPVEYLAELFTAGDAGSSPVSWLKLAAMRAYLRDITLDRRRTHRFRQRSG